MRRVRHLVAGAAVAITAITVGDATTGATVPRLRATGAVLRGANEVPGPGDPDGVGAAGVLIDTVRDRVCYFVTVHKIAPATLAHIHRGGRTVAGPVVVTFEAPADGFSRACVGVTSALADEIAGNPSGFYVNVHNAEFMGGAVRGQLR